MQEETRHDQLDDEVLSRVVGGVHARVNEFLIGECGTDVSPSTLPIDRKARRIVDGPATIESGDRPAR